MIMLISDKARQRTGHLALNAAQVVAKGRSGRAWVGRLGDAPQPVRAVEGELVYRTHKGRAGRAPWIRRPRAGETLPPAPACT